MDVSTDTDRGGGVGARTAIHNVQNREYDVRIVEAVDLGEHNVHVEMQVPDPRNAEIVVPRVPQESLTSREFVVVRLYPPVLFL